MSALSLEEYIVKLEYHSILNFVDNNLNVDESRNKGTAMSHNKSSNNKPRNGYHQRRQTFDASTEFENYQQLFDHETREFLQS